MELRKLLAILLDGLKLLGRKECLLAIGVLTVVLVVLVQLSVSADGVSMAVLAATIQWGLLLAASPILARLLAGPGGVRGPIFWTGWAVSAVAAIVLNVAAAFAATALLFRVIVPQIGPDLITPIMVLVGALANLAWFLPLVHLALAARGDRRLGPGALPGALAPARAAWLVGAFVAGLAVVLMRIGLGALIQSSGLGDNMAAARVFLALGSAIDVVAVLAFTNAAANFVQRPRGQEADVFA